MENEEIVGEQPDVFEGSPLDDFDQTECKTEQSEAERGVPIGKFKSVDDLYHAYNSLQSEFTKKCQKLAEIEKEKTVIPSQEQLEEGLKSFLLENQDAYSYVDEIKSRVFADEKLMTLEKPFDKAWAEMLFEKLSSPNKENEPLVQDLVLKDEKIKNLVIQNYVRDLNQNKSPVVLTCATGEKVAAVATSKPDTFEAAKKVAINLLS